MMRFEECLERGRVGESQIARWLRRRDWCLLPAYEIEISHGKGPRLFTPDRELISPDMLLLHPDQRPCWIEAKHKTVFSWFRRLGRWETGIDAKHWRDYQTVQEQTGIPVWLMFLHIESTPWAGDEPYLPPGVKTCPVGLFTISVSKAKTCARYSREYANGMMYWWRGDLTKLAALDEMCEPDE